jgi:hypothetical protein
MIRRVIAWWHTLSEWYHDLLLAGLMAILALAPRIFGLGVFLTADEAKSWLGRAMTFARALAMHDWAATFDSPAPGVTTMWTGAIGLWLEYLREARPGGTFLAFIDQMPFDPLDPVILPALRLPGVLVSGLLIALVYLWSRKIWGRPAGLLVSAFFALNPFYLALSRVLGHDALMAGFMGASLIALLAALFDHDHPARARNAADRRLLVVSGALGGLAFLSKYPSLFLGVFVALTLLIVHFVRRSAAGQSWQRTIIQWLVDVLLWSLVAGLTGLLLWPVLWVDLRGTLLAIFTDAFRASGSPHPKGSFYLGRPVPDPGAGFYPLVTLFRTTPLVWLGEILAIVSLFGTRHRKETHRYQTILILLFYTLLFGLLVTLGGKKQDRYILPAFPALAALAGLGWTWFIEKTRMGWSRLRSVWSLVVSALVVLGQLAFVLPHHPYYFTYYNPFLGGGRAAARSIVVGWGEGLDQTARWLNSLPDAQDLDVVSWYSTTFEPFFQGHAIYKIEDEKISRTSKPGLAADYVVLYVNQVQRELPSPGALQFLRAAPPVYTVTLHGIDYAWIYPSLRMQHVIAGEARLVGQAELLGYNLLDEDGKSVTALPSNDTTIIQLYWEWQGKSPDDPIGLSLVDESGQTWGWGHPLGTQARLPFEQWKEGMVAHDDFALTVFPGTPPGAYYLKAWIDRPTTGQVVGVFPLAAEDIRLPVVRPLQPLSIQDLALSSVVDAPLTEGIRLLGVADGKSLLEPWQPGQRRHLLLYWRADQTVTQSYSVSLALKDEAGTVRADWTGLPAGGRFPTDYWQAGDVVRDPWTLTLSSNVPPGMYQLTLRLGAEETVPLLTVWVEGRPRSFEVPRVDLPLDAVFGDGIQLVGLQASVRQSSVVALRGQGLEIDLVWRATKSVAADYTVTVQLVDAQQQVQAQRDSMPLDGAAPTTSWVVGEVLPDRISLAIPWEPGPDPHHLLVALYLSNTGERLPVTGGPFAGQDHVEIPITWR